MPKGRGTPAVKMMATTQNILIGAQTFDISAHLYAGSGSAANAATINGNTKLTITNASTVRNNVSVVGTGATSVTSDANGKITINSADTTYSFTDGENSFTATPSGGTAQVVEVTPSLEKSATNSFTDGIDSYFKKVVSSIVPVQAGSGTPSPTNVRAISGFTECTVNDWGVNRFELQFTSQTINGVTFTVENGVIKTQGTASAEIKALIGVSHFDYTGASILSGCPSNGSQETYRLIACDIGGGEYYAEWGEGREISDTRYVARVKISIASGTNVDGLEFKPMVIPKTEAGASFEPYKSTTATISFGSAGTVYGGYVDLVSGRLVVDRGYFVPTSVFTVNNPAGLYRWVVAIPNAVGGTDLISSHFKNSNAVEVGNCYITPDAVYLIIYPTDQTLTSSALANAWLTANKPQFVYKLATPQEYRLTPAQLRSLVGTNNLTSNTGEVTEVEYITNETIAYVDDKVESISDSTFTFTLYDVPYASLTTANTDITQYSSATVAEIKAAINSGKMVVCRITDNLSSSDYFILSMTVNPNTANMALFELRYNNKYYVIRIDLSNNKILSGAWDVAASTTSIATSSGTNQLTLAASTKYALTAGGTSYIFTTPPNSDTKNTAGSTDTSSKIFLIGATSQAANPQTYSDNEVYATNGVLTTKSVQVGGTAATIQYNSTTKSIDFVFA